MEVSDQEMADIVEVITESIAYELNHDSHCCFGCNGWHTPWLHLRDCSFLKELRLLRRFGILPDWAVGKPLTSDVDEKDMEVAYSLQNNEEGLSRLAQIQSKMRH